MREVRAKEKKTKVKDETRVIPLDLVYLARKIVRQFSGERSWRKTLRSEKSAFVT